jgi:hypothetical protein
MQKKVIRQLIDNKATEGEMTECTKVLGDLTRVYILADFWDRNSDLIELLAANGLLDYINGDVDSKQFASYKAGLGYMGFFMGKCANERKRIENQKLKVVNSPQNEGS